MRDIERDEAYFIEEKSDFPFELTKRSGKILLSSPHSVRQLREGKIKIAEFRTGAMVQILGEELNLPVISRTKYNFDDPNYDDKNPYKDKIKEYYGENNFKLLLDFHTAKKEREFDIDVCTGDGENLCGREDITKYILNFFKGKGLNAFENHTFNAKESYTVVREISQGLHVPSVAFEFNWGIIETITKTDDIINILKEMIEGLEEIL